MTASASVASPRPSPVGAVLQVWRRHRRMSQLALSAVSGVTARHISFIETGRAQPSREMLDTLATALAMPLRDRNDLFMAAGYAAPYRELGLDDAHLGDAQLAIEHILASHEPFPGVVMDRHWNLLRTNAGARELFGAMLDLDELSDPANVLELVFDAGGLRRHIVNWELLAPALSPELAARQSAVFWISTSLRWSAGSRTSSIEPPTRRRPP